MARYSVGLDFGTESVRAIVVDCATGREAGKGVCSYSHGVISDRLPGSKTALPHEFALQDAGDYSEAMVTVIREALNEIPANRVVGLGVAATSCTMLPVDDARTPLMFLDEFKSRPHAWVKLWKHHGAQPQADRINRVARERDESFLARCGGSVSSEWMAPKALEILQQDPDVYDATERFVELGDYIVEQMTQSASRNGTAAGFTAFWDPVEGPPGSDFFRAVDRDLGSLPDKLRSNVVPSGVRVGGVHPIFARATGLMDGTPVAAATVGNHAGVTGMGVSGEGTLCLILGTSASHLVMSKDFHVIDGTYGVVKDGIVPGYYAYESGQAAVGDIFNWYARELLTPLGSDPFQDISRSAAALRPGECGLLALDWLNGNRSVLRDSRVGGMLLGLNLGTRTHHIYRALIEGSAFGTRKIVEAHQQAGIPINEIVSCGSLTRDRRLMHIYADVLGLPIKVAASSQAVALGAAILGAMAGGVNAGGHESMTEAISSMTRTPGVNYTPDPGRAALYSDIYEMYKECHDYFGAERSEIMHRLRSLRAGG